MQKKHHSFYEAVISTAVGFCVTLLVQTIIFPLYHIHTTTHENLQITGVFTGVSVIRGYVLRRVFNWWTIKQHQKACDKSLDNIRKSFEMTPAANALLTPNNVSALRESLKPYLKE